MEAPATHVADSHRRKSTRANPKRAGEARRLADVDLGRGCRLGQFRPSNGRRASQESLVIFALTSSGLSAERSLTVRLPAFGCAGGSSAKSARTGRRAARPRVADSLRAVQCPARTHRASARARQTCKLAPAILQDGGAPPRSATPSDTRPATRANRREPCAPAAHAAASAPRLRVVSRADQDRALARLHEPDESHFALLHARDRIQEPVVPEGLSKKSSRLVQIPAAE